MSGKSPTIHDVAAHADVAVGTVSRYLNGETVREGNRQRIEVAIEELSFRRNNAAAAIRRSKTNAVGFILTSFDEFHANVLKRVSEMMRQRGYMVVPYVFGDQDRDADQILDFFGSVRVDGLIASGDIGLVDKIADLQQLNIPRIIYNNDIYGQEVDRVLLNDRKASAKAARHLIEMNHRRIGILKGASEDSTARDRYQGAAEAIQSAGLSHEPARDVAGNGWSEQHGYLGMKDFWERDERPSAVFCSNYLLALGAIRYLLEETIEIPQDMSLVSYGDASHFPLMGNGITALRLPVEQVAESICHMFFSRLGGDDTPLTRTITHECDLIVRGSVRPCRDG